MRTADAAAGQKMPPRGVPEGMPGRWRMVSSYVLAALAATLLNILVQEAVRRLGPAEAITAPILAGTIAGFAAKYALDKVFVFADAYRDRASELRKIVLYGLFSVGTTLVFWGTELAFWWAWHTPQARYTGAVLGLAVGYASKFLLDRTFVFRDARA